MEFWVIIVKLILLLYLAMNYIGSNTGELSWVVLGFLGYFTINILMYIVHNKQYKKVLHLLSLAVIVVCYTDVYHLFIFLFPLNVYELVSLFTKKKWIGFWLAWIPEFFISDMLRYPYGLIVLISFVIYCMAAIYTTRMVNYEGQIDTMRKDLQKLTKSLHDNEAFFRQFEYTSKLEERNRISQEIHDKIGHTMTGALIQMEAAKRLLETGKGGQAEGLLQNAIQISKEGIEQIRLTLKNIKPPTEQIGLNRLKLFLEDFSAGQGIRVALTHKGNIDVITPLQWKTILENVGEALTNTLKYADATVISVDLKVLNKFIRAEVKDNGQGAQKIKKGLGIIGMEERTAALNGTVIVDGSQGFSVTTLLPIHD